MYHNKYTEFAIQIPCTVAHVADEAGQNLAVAFPQRRQFPLCLSVQPGWSAATYVGVALPGRLLGLVHAGKASRQAAGH